MCVNIAFRCVKYIFSSVLGKCLRMQMGINVPKCMYNMLHRGVFNAAFFLSAVLSFFVLPCVHGPLAGGL